MTRILAVDWDDHEVRYVLASAGGKGRKVRVRAAASAPLVEVVDDGGPRRDVGRALRAALAEEKLGHARVLVGVDRAGVELLPLTLPPATDVELPDMVANEVTRESHLADEGSVFDFLAMDDDAAAPRRVTAAVLPSHRLEQVRGICTTARLKPDRIVMRGYGSASLLLRAAPPTEDVCLLVSPVGAEVDFNLLVEGRVALSRTARLPGEAGDATSSARLLDEINRTLAVAVQNEANSGPVSSVYVFGNPAEHERLIEQIEARFPVSATVFDPFAAVEAPADAVIGDSGRFASLLGMVLDEARGVPPAIDFLHPRRPPKRVQRRQVAMAAAAVVVAVAAVVGYVVWDEFSQANAERQAAVGEYRGLEETIKEAEPQRKLYQALSEWQADDVNWLEELRELSEKFPPPGDAVVQRMTMSLQQGGGTISLQGYVGESELITTMAFGLQSRPYRTVDSPSAREKNRFWYFDARVRVKHREKEQYQPSPAP